ncbi:SNF7-like protein [Cryptosporidium canis]|uniref:SNF7-like protein n=1 Tax=Cryptosporidium canis TaxID=195482 RepID=A0ABQ8P499_9CRYT|nr:SNF7-like protein [Cryptosporidium canis]KAJ1611625.1 SNF7-like protein [Cryptosporidium canis]
MFLFRRKQEKEEVNPLSEIESAHEKALKASEAIQRSLLDLEEKEKKLENEAANLALQGDKNSALLVLRRKKLVTQEREKLLSSSLLLEQQLLNLETAKTQQMTMSALSASATAHQSLISSTNTDKLERISDTIKDQQLIHDEISQIINQSLPSMNEADLLEELSAIQAREIDKKILESSDIFTTNNKVLLNSSTSNLDEKIMEKL